MKDMQSEHINLHVTDETSELKTVVLGIGASPGKLRLINAKAIKTYQEGKSPTEENFVSDLAAFEEVLKDNGVKILKPTNIDNLLQMFVRDIGFVVDDFFVVARMKEESRRQEIEGLKSILSEIDENKIINPPDEVFIEGGDVLLFGDTIFVGIGQRTNQAGVDFLCETFPDKEIISFELKHGTGDSKKDILHLDCAFQPIGKQWALFYEEGFASSPQPIIDIFGRENLIPVTSEEMEQLFPNIFSVSTSKVISCSSFTRLNNLMKEKRISVIEVPYGYVSSIGGLLRCSTLPLMRGKN